MKKILHLSPSIFDKGGISQVCYEYKYYSNDFYFVTTTLKGNILLKLSIFIKAIAECVYFFLLRKVNIVHIHTASNISFKRKTIFIYLAKLFKVKVVLHIHGGKFKIFFQKHPYLIRHILNQKVDVVIALSNSWKTFFEQQCGCNNVVVLNNPIPIPDNTVTEKHTSLNILFLGSLCKEKGIYDLLDVMIELSIEKNNDIILYIAGIGDVKKLQMIISENNLYDTVKYEGWVEGENKINLLRNSDILILPSYIEGLPLCILEGMSYKKAIIATNVGAIPEIIDNKSGILFHPGDKAALKEAIMYLYYNPEKCKMFGENGYYISKSFWTESVQSDLFKIYNQLR